MILHIGISGPIGAGKSYLAQQLSTELHTRPLETVHGTRTLVALIMPYAMRVKQIASAAQEYVREQATGTSDIDALNQRRSLPCLAAIWVKTLAQSGIYSQQVCMQVVAKTLKAAEKYQVAQGVKPRKLLQEVGSLGRKIHEDIWVRCAEPTAPFADDVIVLVFHDDMRYENEARSCDYTLRITCDLHESHQELIRRREALCAVHGTQYLNAKHSSESGFDYDFDHNVELIDLNWQRMRILSELIHLAATVKES